MKKQLLAGLLTIAVAAAALTGCGSSGKDDKEWPEKAITFVCPWSAGGDTDFNIRTLAKYVEKELDATITIVNTTGGGGSVASNDVKNQKNDGYTFLAFDSAIALNKASGVTNFGYEAFEPVAMYAKSTGEFIVVRADYPVDTVQELVDYSKEHPGEIKFAANTGGTSYFAATKLKEIGADFNIVNSGSSSERVASLLGKHIDVSINSMGVIEQYIETGELKVLGNMATELPEAYSDYSLVKDEGIDLAYDLVYNLLAPKDTDAAIIEKLSTAIEKVVKENEDYAEEIMTAYGQTPYVLTGEEMQKAFQAEDDMYMEYADEFQSAQ